MERSLLAQGQRITFAVFEFSVIVELGSTGTGQRPVPTQALAHGLLQRFWFGAVLGALLIQERDQFLRRGRAANLASANDVFRAQLPAVQLFVGASIRAER